MGSAQIKGSTKLALHANAFTFANFDSGGSSSETLFEVGPFAPVTAASTLGIPPGGLDIGFGASESVLIGALVRLGLTELSDDFDSNTVGILSLMPHVDLVLAPNSRFRPFVGVVGGISHVFTDDGPTFASVGLEGGGFGFVGDSFSLGPRAALTYSPGVSDNASEFSVLAFQLQLELAGWF
jgi:hypothetical protein